MNLPDRGWERENMKMQLNSSNSYWVAVTCKTLYQMMYYPFPPAAQNMMWEMDADTQIIVS